mgnify:CR=1 FL=1
MAFRGVRSFTASVSSTLNTPGIDFPPNFPDLPSLPPLDSCFFPETAWAFSACPIGFLLLPPNGAAQYWRTMCNKPDVKLHWVGMLILGRFDIGHNYVTLRNEPVFNKTRYWY